MFPPRETTRLHAPPRRLLTSIHDVSPKFESQVDRLRDHLGRRIPADRMSLLVVPNHWGDAPLQPGSPFARRLRGWSDAGADIFLHGWFHRDHFLHRQGLRRFKARHLTAGEGEFLGLDRASALGLMRQGKALLEDIIGRPVTGFVAPAWLYGDGALAALADEPFLLAEDHWRVWQPADGAVLGRGPVLTWASRSRVRIAASLLAARMLRPVLAPMRLARLAVHPGDTLVPSLMASIDRSLAQMMRTRVAARYSDLLARP